ncbi:hypothetical protein PFISCL1PPCAC_17573 [Pristionchus fissidentatus]|uniref:Protein SEC13 homolog n=1 Tax=Pristionchus fissidentatus TaxID=1538716 RepID=A0AAV5W387_9BILA|nr:hypothetical protein PFISCL1PPCAC_17573 [Pristionchus fissidentatus]
MATVVSRVDTSHTDAINDAQLNYHGTRLATCSNDKSIRVFDIKPNGQSYPMAELTGHLGPVWKLSWAHPRFDSVLASAGYDKRVVVWQETSGRFTQLHDYGEHEGSVNSVTFAPHQYGLVLATASADGSFAVLSFDYDSRQWAVSKVTKAHDQGVNAISWAPVVQLGAFEGRGGESGARRLVTAGNDKLVKIWCQTEPGAPWQLERQLKGHTDFVRDVAWNPVVHHDTLTIASCGEDRSVLLWRCRGTGEGEWSCKQLELAEGALWHVSWSQCGSILAVSGEDNKIAYWKENLQREWIRSADEERQQ